jgi:hypothetical protein
VTDLVVEDESAEQPVQAPRGPASDEQLISMPMERARTQGLTAAAATASGIATARHPSDSVRSSCCISQR